MEELNEEEMKNVGGACRRRGPGYSSEKRISSDGIDSTWLDYD